MKRTSKYENTYFFRGYPFSIRYLHIEDTFPLHWHHYVEIIYAMQEGLLYEVDEEPIALNRGDMLFIWPGELHGIRRQEKPQKALMLQFNSQLLTERRDFQKAAHIIYGTRLIKGEEPNTAVARIQNIMQEIRDVSENEELFMEMKVCSLIYELIIHVGNMQTYVNQTRKSPLSEHTQRVEQQILDACQFITANCREKISLDQAAEAAGFSKYHFSKVFKRCTGQSFSAFQAKERLRIAETLLKDPDLTITEAALESGFGSISTFNRVFRQYKKVNPTEFRELLV